MNKIIPWIVGSGAVLVLVIVVGVNIFSKAKGEFPVTAKSSTITKLTQISTTTETTNWKTYHNDKFNFELKYPPDGEVKDVPMPSSSEEALYLDIKYNKSVGYLLINKNTNHLSLKEYVLDPYVNCISGNEVPCLAVPELVSFHLGDVEGLHEKNVETNNGSYFFFPNGGSDFVYIYSPSSLQPYDEKMFHDIFSTFKFTQSGSSSIQINSSLATSNLAELFDGKIDTTSYERKINRNNGQLMALISPDGIHYPVSPDASKTLMSTSFESGLSPVTQNNPNVTYFANSNYIGMADMPTCEFQNILFSYNVKTMKVEALYSESQTNIHPDDYRFCRKMKINGMSGNKILISHYSWEAGDGPCNATDTLFIADDNIGYLDISNVARGMVKIRVSDDRKAAASEALSACQNSPDI